MLIEILIKNFMEKKSEYLRYILTRYDNYINAANVKGTFIVALNTFVIGCLIVNRNSLLNLFDQNHSISLLINVIIYIICIVALAILTSVISALFPYMKTGNSSVDKYHSHIFFGSVKNFKSEEHYKNSFNNLKENDITDDLSNQIYTLSKGLTKKYKYLNIAMIFIYIEISLFLLIMILIPFK